MREPALRMKLLLLLALLLTLHACQNPSRPLPKIEPLTDWASTSTL
jgi:hypothetical protein